MSVRLPACLFVILFAAATVAQATADEPADDKAAAVKPIVDAANPLSTELSDDEIAYVDKIVDDVGRRWQAQPRAPLPAESKSPPSAERSKCYNAWIESLYLDAWRAHGKHDPRWNDGVEKLLRDVAKPNSQQPPKRETAAQARKLLEQGCDDPLVRYALAISLDIKAGTAVYQVIDALRPALEKLGADYSPAVAYRIELRYVQAWERAYRDKAQEDAPIVERLIDRMIGLICAPLDDDERRRQLQRLSSALEHELRPHAKLFFQKLAASPQADRWLVQMLLARAHVNLAWQERGGGYAGTVTEQGWRGFGKHLAKARSLLLQAWHERPDLPEAAHDQIAVTMGAEGVAGEDPRFWFDRAVAADFDMPNAYSALLWAMRPRWGGSHELMLQFGRECLSTNRFDTAVPWFFHRTVCDILSESGDPRDACLELNIYDDYVRYIEGSRPHAESDEARRNLDTALACVAWLSGHDDEARRLLKQLGNQVSVKAVGDFYITLSDMRLALSGMAERAPPGERWLEADVDQIRFAAKAKWLLGFGTFTGLVAFDMSSGGQPIFDLPEKVEGQLVRDFDITSDGELLALILMSDGDDQTKTGTVVLWDVTGARIRTTLKLASEWPAYRVRFSPDGKWLAAGMMDGSVTVWKVESGERPSWGHWPAHRAWIEALAFTADGKHLATASADWKVMLFDLPDATDAAAKAPAAKAEFGPFAGPPLSVAFSPDGRRLLVGHDYCELWDVAERKTIRQLPGSRVAYAPDGRTFTTGGGELVGDARIWDAETGAERARLIGAHHYALTTLLYSPNGRRIVSGSADPACSGEGVIRCWDAQSGEEIFDFEGCCEESK